MHFSDLCNNRMFTWQCMFLISGSFFFCLFVSSIPCLV